MKHPLVILINDKISKSENSLFGENLDSKSIPEGLSKNFQVELIGRSSSVPRPHEIKIKNINKCSNIFHYLFIVIKTVFKKNKYLIISISPSTFLSAILLFLFGKKPFLYLRSDGFEEYKKKLGILGQFIYRILFYTLSLRCELISCNRVILRGKKGSVVSPSQLNTFWFKNFSKPNFKKINLLYVGRMKVEKGIFNLIEILNKIEIDFNLKILPGGDSKKIDIKNKKIQIIEFDNVDHEMMTKIYDDTSIFILPSYTEGHPQVLDEALSRRRPVIIFEDIKHIVENRTGIFVSERRPESLLENIKFISQNNETIFNDMEKNNLPTKDNFIKQMVKIIN